MPRQFYAQARFNGSTTSAMLHPSKNLDRQVIGNERVAKAIAVLKEHRWMLTIGVACGLFLVSLSQFEQPAEAPNAWLFDKDYPYAAEETNGPTDSTESSDGHAT